jgi:hypothetical protein
MQTVFQFTPSGKHRQAPKGRTHRISIFPIALRKIQYRLTPRKRGRTDGGEGFISPPFPFG